KVLGGVVDGEGKVLATRRYRTPVRDVGQTVEVIGKIAAELSDEYRVSGMGIAIAGYVDANQSVLQHSPNLPWGDDVEVRKLVTDIVDMPVVLENDANAAAWGEFRFGAGKGAKNLVLLTIGTGIGSGFVLGGRLYRGSFGKAAELGHQLAVPDGEPCGCGGRGCMERYASGTALERYAREAIAADPGSGARLLELSGGEASAIVGAHVQQAGREGDPASLAAFDRVGYWLGVAFADVVFSLDPDRIVVGGGVSESGDLLFEPAMTAYREVYRSRRRSEPVATVALAALGNEAGLVGAADLARV
ncbi:MAG TPA: ROK family glucokinase, partial [Mycobacteriales bacterium]|nr:ROK family glucokinase [Mycobacteriales bacterium]